MPSSRKQEFNDELNALVEQAERDATRELERILDGHTGEELVERFRKACALTLYTIHQRHFKYPFKPYNRWTQVNPIRWGKRYEAQRRREIWSEGSLVIVGALRNTVREVEADLDSFDLQEDVVKRMMDTAQGIEFVFVELDGFGNHTEVQDINALPQWLLNSYTLTYVKDIAKGPKVHGGARSYVQTFGVDRAVSEDLNDRVYAIVGAGAKAEVAMKGWIRMKQMVDLANVLSSSDVLMAPRQPLFEFHDALMDLVRERGQPQLPGQPPARHLAHFSPAARRLGQQASVLT